jgi:hypothetical protein
LAYLSSVEIWFLYSILLIHWIKYSIFYISCTKLSTTFELPNKQLTCS